MKNTKKIKILTPEEIAAIKAAAKILKKIQKEVNQMPSHDEQWFEELYKEAKIDFCDGMHGIDVASRVQTVVFL